MIMSGIDKDPSQNWHTESFLLDPQVDLFGSGNSPIFTSTSEFGFQNSIYELHEGQLDGPQTPLELSQSLREISSPVTSQEQIRHSCATFERSSASKDTVVATVNVNTIQQDCPSTLQSLTPLIPPPPLLPSLTRERRIHDDQTAQEISFEPSVEYVVSDPTTDFLETPERGEAGLNRFGGDPPFEYVGHSYNAQPPAVATAPSEPIIPPMHREVEMPAIKDDDTESSSRRRSIRIKGQKPQGAKERRKSQPKPYSNNEKPPRRKRNSAKDSKEPSNPTGSDQSRRDHLGLTQSAGILGAHGENASRGDHHSTGPLICNSSFAPLSDSYSDPKKAFVQIIEQPQSKALRFRYICEGRSAGSIPGVRSKSESKTYPTVKICNFKGSAYVKVSCVTKDPPHFPHPHNLVGKEGCREGICTVKANDAMECIFPNLGIQCIKRKDVEEALSKRQKNRIDPFETGYDHLNNIQDIDLNAVRLCFQAFVEDTKTGKTVALKPVVSNPIYDKKATSDLSIYKMSECSGSAKGGNELILLCEKVSREDIKVRFYEYKNGRLHWEDFGDFQTSDVHKQVAICLKTPKYKDLEIESPITVSMQLLRPSDRSKSDPRTFTYLPMNSDALYIKKKMEKLASNRSLENLLQVYLPNLDKLKGESVSVQLSAPPPPPPPIAVHASNFEVSLQAERERQSKNDTRQLSSKNVSLLQNEKLVRQKRVYYQEHADDLSLSSGKVIHFPETTTSSEPLYHSKTLYQSKEFLEDEFQSRRTEKHHENINIVAQQKRYMNVLKETGKDTSSQRRPPLYRDQPSIGGLNEDNLSPPPLLYGIPENVPVLMEIQETTHHIQQPEVNQETPKRSIIYEHSIVEPRQITCYPGESLRGFNSGFDDEHQYLSTIQETNDPNNNSFTLQSQEGVVRQDQNYNELRSSIPSQIPNEGYASAIIIDLDTHRRIESSLYIEQAQLSSTSPEVTLPLETFSNAHQSNSKEVNKMSREFAQLEPQNSYNNLDDLLPEEINLIYS